VILRILTFDHERRLSWPLVFETAAPCQPRTALAGKEAKDAPELQNAIL
jgi:hypothetical protein